MSLFKLKKTYPSLLIQINRILLIFSEEKIKKVYEMVKYLAKIETIKGSNASFEGRNNITRSNKTFPHNTEEVKEAGDIKLSHKQIFYENLQNKNLANKTNSAINTDTRLRNPDFTSKSLKSCSISDKNNPNLNNLYESNDFFSNNDNKDNHNNKNFNSNTSNELMLNIKATQSKASSKLAINQETAKEEQQKQTYKSDINPGRSSNSSSLCNDTKNHRFDTNSDSKDKIAKCNSQTIGVKLYPKDFLTKNFLPKLNEQSLKDCNTHVNHNQIDNDNKKNYNENNLRNNINNLEINSNCTDSGLMFQKSIPQIQSQKNLENPKSKKLYKWQFNNYNKQT